MAGVIERATICVYPEHPVDGLAVFLVGGEVDDLFDPLDHQHFALFFYLPDRLGVEALYGNLTRCQRASKGAEQSPTSRSNQVIQGARVWVFLIRGNPVVFGDLAVYTEQYGLFFTRHVGPPQRPLYRLHLYT